MQIAIIGCGNLGQAIAWGLLDNGDFSPSDVMVTRRNTSLLSELDDRGVHVTSDNAMAVQKSDIIILALKPYNILPITEELKTSIDPGRHTVVSLATGISIEQMRQVLPEGTALFRAMPNTAADVRQSMTCLCTEETTTEKRSSVQSVFESLGSALYIDESLMEAATVLGACGIAFVMRFIRAMVQGGIEIGFSADMASAIVQQTVKGASELLIDGGRHPEHEIDKVTTPRGCTIAGLNEMEHHGFSSSLIKGITTSFNRIE